jgi:hypothetical protein
MSQPLVLHDLLQIPAHQLIKQAYRLVLEREPAFIEEVYHLARLNRGCSRKLFLLSVLYSAEAQEGYPHKYYVGGTALRVFHKIAKGQPKLAKLLIKTMYYFDVIAGRAREFAYQFQAEYQLCWQQEWQQQQAQLNHKAHMLQQEWQQQQAYQLCWQQEWQQQQAQLNRKAHMLQQDVQRRIDLFLLESMQSMSGQSLSPAEKDAWRHRLEQARQEL